MQNDEEVKQMSNGEVKIPDNAFLSISQAV